MHEVSIDFSDLRGVHPPQNLTLTGAHVVQGNAIHFNEIAAIGCHVQLVGVRKKPGIASPGGQDQGHSLPFQLQELLFRFRKDMIARGQQGPVHIHDDRFQHCIHLREIMTRLWFFFNESCLTPA